MLQEVKTDESSQAFTLTYTSTKGSSSAQYLSEGKVPVYAALPATLPDHCLIAGSSKNLLKVCRAVGGIQLVTKFPWLTYPWGLQKLCDVYVE